MRKRERVRCSSLVDWPVYPRLAHTMRASNGAQCGTDAAASHGGDRIRLHRRSARRKLMSVWSARMAMIGRRQDFSRLCGARFTDLARPEGTKGGSPLAQADAEVPPFARSVFTGT
jgi:hypothetical protein